MLIKTLGKIGLFALGALALVSQSCSTSNNEQKLQKLGKTNNDASNGGIESQDLNILAFGDWGTGTPSQFEHAKGLEKHCKAEKCDFGLMLGDSFYPAGVKSVNDPFFKERFEDVYGPLGIPFYVVLGNHDYGVILKQGNPQAQVDYTKKSNFWKMPSKYYSFVQGDTTFIGLDTEKFTIEQIDWLDKTISTAKTKWKIVMGHHPIRSYGQHGDTPYLVEGLLPRLCNKVDLYLAGHDHDMQALKDPCGLNMIVSGAASKLRDVNKGALSKFAVSEPGFAKLQITDNQIDVRFISTTNDRDLYRFSVTK
jgi:predicted phosphodiesterase